MKIIRVFPRKTNATPDDALVRFGPPGLFDKADEIHISVAFTYDLKRAEELAKEWSIIAPVKIGGPALGMRGEEFTPGMYLKKGYVITSRGCPNRCERCFVPEREGKIREYPICDGWNVIDDNLLACSDQHVRAVFAMLKNQKQKAEFTGGLEAARFQDWHVDLLADLKPKQIFFAYDREQTFDALANAARRLFDAGFTSASHTLRCYVLAGFPGDTQREAQRRFVKAMSVGFFIMPMRYRDKVGKTNREWSDFFHHWTDKRTLGIEFRNAYNPNIRVI